MNQISLVIVIVGLFGAALGQVDWCAIKKSYCGTAEHIACLPNSFPYTTCTNYALVPLTAAMKSYILLKHNQYRQIIASGSNTKYPAASKMGEMKWDDTLQYLAEQHASHCTWAHDQCRATADYPYSGQNLYMSSSTLSINVTDALGKGADSWYSEWNVGSVTLVDSFLGTDINAGHFSVMVKDVNARVGCAAITYSAVADGKNWNRVQITCNYQNTNILTKATYAKGTPCSACANGCSTTYNALCQTYVVVPNCSYNLRCPKV